MPVYSSVVIHGPFTMWCTVTASMALPMPSALQLQVLPVTKNIILLGEQKDPRCCISAPTPMERLRYSRSLSNHVHVSETSSSTMTWESLLLREEAPWVT